MRDESAFSGSSSGRALIQAKEQQKLRGCREHSGDSMHFHVAEAQEPD